MQSSPPPILAHHLVLSSYRFWLANDPRGSGSSELREEKFADLGDVHRRRHPLRISRAELRAFYAKASPRLDHKPIWFDEAMRACIISGFRQIITRCKYTVWGCSVGSNHVHLCVRRHRDPYQTMFTKLTGQTRAMFAENGWIDSAHPLWANRPYSVYCHTPDDIRRVIGYIEENPEKEGLPVQRHDFVQVYDGWSFASGRSGTK